MYKRQLITSGKNTTLEQAKKILLENRVEKLPIVDKNFKLVGLITIKDIDNQMEYPNANKDKNGRLIVGAGVGVGEDTIDRVFALVEAGVDIIAVDSAHGHSRGVLDKISEIRKNFPELDIVAVSYTHLDVYKRQENERSSGINFIHRNKRFFHGNHRKCQCCHISGYKCGKL